jgi:hypothetical protein
MEGPKGCKACLLSVKKRLNHRDPHVVLYALSLLDCLWNNCGQKFRREVSSKEFINELSYKCTNVGMNKSPSTGGEGTTTKQKKISLKAIQKAKVLFIVLNIIDFVKL